MRGARFGDVPHTRDVAARGKPPASARQRRNSLPLLRLKPPRSRSVRRVTLSLLSFSVRLRGSTPRSKLRLPIRLGMVADVAINDTVLAGLAPAIRAFHLGGQRFAVAGEPLPRAPGATRLRFSRRLPPSTFILPVALGSVRVERAATLGVAGMCRVTRESPRRSCLRRTGRSARRFPEHTVRTAHHFGSCGNCRT
jgi:hypothetical protein